MLVKTVYTCVHHCTSNTSSKALKCCGHLFHSTEQNEQTAMPSTLELPAVARCSLSSTNPLLLESAPHTTENTTENTTTHCKTLLCSWDIVPLRSSCFGICSLHLTASRCKICQTMPNRQPSQRSLCNFVLLILLPRAAGSPHRCP